MHLRPPPPLFNLRLKRGGGGRKGTVNILERETQIYSGIFALSLIVVITIPVLTFSFFFKKKKKKKDEGNFIVSKFSDIEVKIIPFFKKYPIHGVKALDFAGPFIFVKQRK